MTRITLCIMIPLLLFGVSITGDHPKIYDDPTERDHVFLVVFEPGPAWIEGKPVGEQNLREHGRYLLNLYAEGKILQAGPFTNDTGGAIIYRAENLAEAGELVAGDPAVISQIFTATISPWRWVEWDYHLERNSQ